MNKQQLLPASIPISFSERIRYSVGCLGFPCAMIMYNSIIMFYFTNVLGINAAAAGVLLLVARVLGGINDTVMGILVDKTNTRWGKARPYIFVGGVILSVFTFLLFSNPGFKSEGGKIKWAYFTYIGFGTAYTAFSVSLKVFSARMTRDRNEITSLNSHSYLGISVGSIFGALTLATFTNYFAGEFGDIARGYSLTALIIAGLVLVCTFILASIRERDFTESEKAPDYSLGDALKALFSNGPFIGFCLAATVVYIGSYLATSTLMYYCIYNLGRQNYYAILTVVEYGAPIAASLLIPILVKRFGKKVIISTAFAGMAAGYGLRYITGDKNVLVMLTLAMIAGVSGGFWNVLLTPTTLDCAVFTRFKTGLQMDSLFISVFSLIQRLVSGICGAFFGILLERVGFNAELAVQSDAVLSCLRICCTAAVAASSIVGLVLFLLMFRVKDSQVEEMSRALRAREGV